MEHLIEAALRERGLDFVDEHHPLNVAKLDFHLPQLDLYIEVKRMHSPRIADQMARGANVIAIQGKGAVRAFVEMLSKISRSYADRIMPTPAQSAARSKAARETSTALPEEAIGV